VVVLFITSVVRDLGVWIDDGLSASTHVTKVVSSCFALQHPLFSQPRVTCRTGSDNWITATMFLLDCLHTSSIGFSPSSMHQLA